MDDMARYIDIHTHRQTEQPGAIAIRNVFARDSFRQEGVSPPFTGGDLFSVGVHPWHADDIEMDIALDMIRVMAQLPACAAIGEIGLDRACDVDFDLQREVFVAQCRLACESGLPVIVHSARTHADILQVHKSNVFPPIWIVHGFRGKLQTAGQLLRNGARLSFGEALLRAPAPLREAFLAVPDDRLYLETDEAGCSIMDVYAAAAGLREVTVEQLREQLYANFIRDFGITHEDTPMA